MYLRGIGAHNAAAPSAAAPVAGRCGRSVLAPRTLGSQRGRGGVAAARSSQALPPFFPPATNGGGTSGLRRTTWRISMWRVCRRRALARGISAAHCTHRGLMAAPVACVWHRLPFALSGLPSPRCLSVLPFFKQWLIAHLPHPYLFLTLFTFNKEKASSIATTLAASRE